MTWNHRLFRYIEDEEKLLYISEAYYNKKGKLISYVEPIEIFDRGLYGSDLKELKNMLKCMKKAIKHPVVLINKNGEIIREHRW